MKELQEELDQERLHDINHSLSFLPYFLCFREINDILMNESEALQEENDKNLALLVRIYKKLKIVIFFIKEEEKGLIELTSFFMFLTQFLSVIFSRRKQ